MRPFAGGISRIATTSTSGPTASTSRSGWRRSGCARSCSSEIRPDGTKEVVALEDGYRESAESWPRDAPGSQAPRDARPRPRDRGRRTGVLGCATRGVSDHPGATLLVPLCRPPDYADLRLIGAGQPGSPGQSGRHNPGTVRLFLPALEEERSRTVRHWGGVIVPQSTLPTQIYAPTGPRGNLGIRRS